MHREQWSGMRSLQINCRCCRSRQRLIKTKEKHVFLTFNQTGISEPHVVFITTGVLRYDVLESANRPARLAMAAVG